MQKDEKNNAPLWLAWSMWGLVALLYCVGYFQRMAPAVLADDLMRDFNLGGALLGNLSAMYFYSYAAMQVPTGLLVDQIGPRKLASAACATAAAGILIFSFGSSLWLAYAGRFLVGASVAVAWVTCMKLAGHWFPANRFATVTGVALLLGNLGGIMAGVPLALSVDLFGWRASMGLSGFLMIGLGLATWLFLRDDPGEYDYRSYAHSLVQNEGSLPAGKALRSVLSRRDTWLLFFAGGLSTAPVLVFAGLWGVPYLTQIYNLQTSQAALLTSTMLLSFAFSGPFLGMISDRMGRRKLPYLFSTVFTTVFWSVFLFVRLPHIMLFPLLAAIGFTSGALIIGFAAAREINHPGAAGAVGGVVNMSVLGVAAVMQPVLGKILDAHWDGTMAAGARVYNEAAYFSAFIWLVIAVGLSVIMVSFTKETYCRIQND